MTADIRKHVAQFFPSFSPSDLGLVAGQQQAQIIAQAPINRSLEIDLQNLRGRLAFWSTPQKWVLRPGKGNIRGRGSSARSLSQQARSREQRNTKAEKCRSGNFDYDYE